MLEPLRVEHATEMVEVLSDPELYAFTGGEPPLLDELRERYRFQVVGHSPDESEEWLNWIVRRAEDGQAVGYVQATVRDNFADIAWVIGRAWQGNGYGSEATAVMVEWLDHRGVAAITAHIHPDHAASAAVAAKVGLSPTDEVDDGEVVWRRTAGGDQRANPES